MFSPPKLLLISKLIFNRLMLHVELGLVKFIRNVKKGLFMLRFDSFGGFMPEIVNRCELCAFSVDSSP